MPVNPRVLIDGAAYHVIVRGNQRQKVFRHEDDFRKYLELLWKYRNSHKVKVYAYCLMSNHVHLLLDPSDKISLNGIMHALGMSYAKHFNYKYTKCGHLWQGRYKSYPIQKDQYLINCMTYIEMNPVRAAICQRPEDYPWSSYSARTLGSPNKILDDYVV